MTALLAEHLRAVAALGVVVAAAAAVLVAVLVLVLVLASGQPSQSEPPPWNSAVTSIMLVSEGDGERGGVGGIMRRRRRGIVEGKGHCTRVSA